jgi:RNA polymerase sigma factor (sigma-70 family)
MASGQFGSVLQFLRRAVRPGANDETTDRQLLARFAARRDEEAFATLVRRHGPMVLAVCRRVLEQAPDADDAFQATFLVLAEKAGAPGWQESVGSWLYEVAYRVALKLRGDAARRRLHERQVPPMATVDAEVEKTRHDLRTVLDEELTHLPAKYRAPLVLCYLEGKTNEEAAAQLGWTKGTVSGRLARARDLLRARLTRRGLALAATGLAAALTETANAAGVPPALLQATVQAAVFGTAARAAAAGAVAAPVAALVQGVTRTMFLTKIKIVALVAIALGLLGTSAGLAAYHVLGRNEAVAVFAPLPEQQPAAPAAPKAAEPAEKNGLAVTVTPTKAVFDRGEALSFDVTFKNVSEKTFLLNDPANDNSFGWRYDFEQPDAGKKWFAQLKGDPRADALRAPRPPAELAPGKALTIRAVLSTTYYQFKLADDDKIVIAQTLAPGRYQVRMELGWATPNRADAKPKFPFWTGQMTTNPVSFAIADPEAAKVSAQRVKVLKEHIDKFSLRLSFFGSNMRGYYSVKLSTDQKQLAPGDNQLHLKALLTKAQAEKIIDQLAAEGFFAEASDKLVRASDAQQSYFLELGGPPDMVLTQVLPRDRRKLQDRLEGLKKLLDGDAAAALGKLVARLTAAPAGQDPIIQMQRRRGFGPEGGKVISKFEVLADGSFTYDGAQGKLPKEEIAALTEQIAKADVGPPAEDAGSVAFAWLDKDGLEQSKLFTRPAAAGALLQKMADLKAKYAK